MKTLRDYVAREIAISTLLVFVALLLLFAFFDLVEQMKDLGRGAYQLRHILLHVLLSAPNHVYELFPIAALIGTLFAVAQLVASSEYTVMRAAGVSLARITGVIALVGAAFGAVTFIVGEFLAPPAEQFAQRLRSQTISGIVAQEFRSGLWIKDGTAFINVAEITPPATLSGVRIYEFDEGSRLRSLRYAAGAEYQGQNRWTLRDVTQTEFGSSSTRVSRHERMEWQSVLDPALLSVLQVKPEKMSAWSLYSYSQHLKENRQKSLRYEIALWSKLLYPVAVVVMMILALPFAYFQNRQGGVGAKIFAGIMLGLGFHFLNRLFGHLGLLNDWPPVLGAIGPMLLFMAVAVAMMWWQERR
ncbi:MAG: LPS export ABC transporter permease LptG [Polaromonas sp.]|uniref:LPS export ABC transporter permease LptG n=1 Tax=Polaromonas sp. TaxID=1869339 RepID=UPI002733904E|nr:LPS export ABC transporter permease LptG [Polaromonas sp.]MDP1673836.1 LPS export ABC transporter permease LptG [Burkholderiales bacterium]MDP3246621.1 LPS export ABC transporter permease LptG [Polaromonas sp.]